MTHDTECQKRMDELERALGRMSADYSRACEERDFYEEALHETQELLQSARGQIMQMRADRDHPDNEDV